MLARTNPGCLVARTTRFYVVTPQLFIKINAGFPLVQNKLFISHAPCRKCQLQFKFKGHSRTVGPYKESDLSARRFNDMIQ